MPSFYSPKELRSGHTIIFKNQPHLVIDHSFNKTAMRGGIIKCKLKNLITKSIVTEELTGLKIEQALLVHNKARYSYQDSINMYFINESTYEEIKINLKDIEWEIHFINEDILIDIVYWDEKIIAINLPETTYITLTKVEEAVRGDTASPLTKLGWTSTGLEVTIPQFIKENEKVLVYTIDGKYKSR